MSLDIAILDEDERPIVSRSVGTREHAELVSIAKRIGAKCVSRFEDYYGDAEIAVDELPTFRDELKSLLTQPSLSRDVVDLLDVLESMSVRAMRERRKIVAVAD
jgi:hypothetical protein